MDLTQNNDDDDDKEETQSGSRSKEAQTFNINQHDSMFNEIENNPMYKNTNNTNNTNKRKNQKKKRTKTANNTNNANNRNDDYEMTEGNSVFLW